MLKSILEIKPKFTYLRSMTKESAIRLFQDQKVRVHWDEEAEKWYFCIVDIVEILTDSINPGDYVKKMRKRDPELSKGWGQIVTPLSIQTAGGKQRLNCSDTEGIFRIIQSIPSQKAEPFKLWLAKVGYERIEETEDPELAFDRAMETYLKKGYSKNWINQRIKSIEVRKELTDEWEERGVKKGLEYAILTDEITKAWAGLSTKEYKKLKDLKKEGLRDNMTNLELVLNMLAEASTTEISKEKEPKTLAENKDVAKKGGKVAQAARKQLESTTGKKVVSKLNAKSLKSKEENKKLKNKDEE